MARGEDQDDPSRGGAEDGSDEAQGNGAEWLLRQLGAGGPGGEDPGSPSRRPGTPKQAKPPKEPRTPATAGRPGAALPAGVPSAPQGDSRRKIVLLLIALAVAAVLALASLFFLGVRLGAGSVGPAAPTPTASASASATPSPTPTPTPTEEPVAGAGPVAPGTRPWDELRGGECVDPYSDPWEEEYTVVDCADPHPAQLVYRGEFPTDAPGYPGDQAILPQLSLLCSAPTVIDSAAAAPYSDLQVQGAYPATAEQWEAGQRDIFCFLSRSTGQPLTGSVAVPQAAPAE